jgi:AraC-like DNA-binding protein
MSPRLAEPSIPAVHALHLAQICARWNVTPGDLFAGLDLSEATLTEPGRRISIPVVNEIVARSRALTGEPGLGYYLGLQMRVSAHGYLGFAAMSSSTVGEALDLAARFAPTRTTALALRMHVDGGLASLIIEELAPLGAAQDVILFALTVGLQKIGEALTGRPLGGQAEFMFSEPAYLSHFHPLAASLRFGQPAHRLIFPASVLDLPIVMADPAALRLAREQCERELDALGHEGSITMQVRSLLSVHGGGFRSLDEVAALLSMSPRSLKRRLAEQSAEFSALLDQERRDRALLLLASDLPLESLAERLGYSDVANFSRAFRRWTGTTPGAFRRSRGSAEGGAG